jgi:hypothetical protein
MCTLTDVFLEAYKEEIIAELKKGPVLLSDANNICWLKVDDTDTLPQLVGLYTAPEWLGHETAIIGIAVSPNKLNVRLSDGVILEGDDLSLHLLRSAEETQAR